MNYRWVSLLGQFQIEEDNIRFTGGVSPTPDGQTLFNVGNLISDQVFGAGSISADIVFMAREGNEICDLVLHYHPAGPGFITAGLGGAGLCVLRSFWGQWTNHAMAGTPDQILPNRPYSLRVSARGSSVRMILDGVNVLDANLPFPLPRGQAGIWCMGASDIQISNFAVQREKPRAFVVMQYTPPYNELYSDVIYPVCDELGLEAIRADEVSGPGVIIADIANQIAQATIVIADITPRNPNVYYEVGFAHATKKPTILVADRGTQLPFDVSPFRTLFYENTIAGKAKVEDGLRRHLLAIQSEWGAA